MRKIILLTLLSIPLSALAEDPTPTPTPEVTATATPAATATPTSCQLVQSCVDAGVSSVLSSCAAATPECVVETNDQFAASAVALARRAIDDLAKCQNKSPEKASVAACRMCYERAAEPYRVRFKPVLLHGLFARAVSIIRDEKNAVCLPSKKERSGEHGRDRGNR